MNIKKHMITLAIGVLTVGATSFQSYATEGNIYAENVIQIEEDEQLANATLVDEQMTRNGREITTTKTYIAEDGTEIIDTLTYNENFMKSKNGSDSVNRTRTVTNFGTVYLSATFTWKTEGLFSYVKCDKMSASKTVKSGAECGKFEKSYTENYVSIGTANASVSYKFHNSKNPMEYQSGTFKITCTDEGKISDNG